MWRGNNAKKSALHLWVKDKVKKPKYCNMCKIKTPYDLANISGKYLRDLGDWQWLCRRCHMISDGRMNNLKQFQGRELSQHDIDLYFPAENWTDNR